MDLQKSRLDASETAFFARQLEYVKSRSYDIEFPTMKAKTLFPVSTDAGEGAVNITYQQFEETGMARIIANYADDLPRADLRGKEFTSKVVSLGASYGYSVRDIRSARMAGLPLQARQASAARRAVEQKENALAWNGDDNANVLGLFNNSNIPAASVPNDGTGASTLWTTKTPDLILRDMNLITNGIMDLTKGVERPNTLLLPIAQYSLIASTRMSTGTDTTILQYYLNNNPFVNVVEWVPELKGAGPNGVDVMVAYDRNPDKLELQIPMPYNQYPPQERNLDFVINAESRFGGLIVYYPLSVSIGEGI